MTCVAIIRVMPVQTDIRSMAPGLAVSLNGSQLLTISSEGFNILGVRVSGDRISPEFASLDISAGLYGEEDQKHLIWEPGRVVWPGDEIEVTLLESAITSEAGRTIEEVYSDDTDRHGPWPSMEQVQQGFEQRPILRERFTFMITQPSGQSIGARTFPNDHIFGFSVMWDWLHPAQARVCLHSNTLDGLAKRQGGSTHARFLLHFGQRVRFRVES